MANGELVYANAAADDIDTAAAVVFDGIAAKRNHAAADVDRGRRGAKPGTGLHEVTAERHRAATNINRTRVAVGSGVGIERVVGEVSRPSNDAYGAARDARPITCLLYTSDAADE